jgi:hypothetical protein
MADGEVKIDTKLDTSGLDKGLRNVKNKVNKSTKDIGKGTKSTNALKTAFNETGGAASSFASRMGSVASSGGAVAVGITTAILAAKKFIETLKQADEAYKVQEKAESALQKAAENNPYLNRESVQHLKDYASEIQSISNFGDEGTIDVMAQLAASGRNESEIMNLVSAAADYAAAKHISLESAVQNLNKSYGGLAGELGELFPEVKALTAEQLKNGEAVDIIASKYKGFAAEAADSSTQAKNSFGDFMESIGKIAHPTFEALNARAKSFWETMTSAMGKFNEALEEARETWIIGGDYRWSKDFVKDINENLKSVHSTKKTGFLEDNAESLSDENIRHITVYLEAQKKMNDNEREFLQILKDEKTHRDNRAAAAKEYATYAEKWKGAKKEELQAWLDTRENIDYSTQELKAVADALKAVEEQEKKNAAQAGKTADEYAKKSNQNLEESLHALEVEAKAKGEAVSAQDKYNVYLQSYIDLLTKTEGLINEGYPVEQKRIEQLQEAKKAVEEAADAEEKLAAATKLTQEVTETLNGIQKDMTPVEVLQKEIEEIETLKAQIKSMSDEEIAAAQAGAEAQLSKAELINGLNEAEKQAYDEKVNALTEKETSWWDKHANKQKEILDLKKEIDESEVLSTEEKYDRMKELDEAYKQSKTAQIAELMTQINDYTSQAVDIINNAANLILETSKNNATAEQAVLEAKYHNGEISEEEYNVALTESKRKAAREQYKIQMIQWSASILQATANTALGVTQAIAEGGAPVGIIMGALAAAAGAVQIASIIANKPTPPSFSTGGIVGGSSTHGDNIAANLNSREMVMNMSQQKGLWDFLNGGANGAGGANIVINNSAANIATAQPKITRDKIEIMIDARVNDSMKKGRYDQSMNEAKTGMTGDYYGI